MKKSLIILSMLIFTAGMHAEQLYRVAPSEMVLMDTLDEESPTTLVVSEQNRSMANAEVEEEVISADEYLAGSEEEEMPLVDLSDASLSKPKIALLVPRKVIGSYANSVANSILSYLIYRQGHFIFEVFDSGRQSEDDLRLALGKIRQKGYKIIIAPLTPAGANLLTTLQSDALVYVPTVNSADIEYENPNFIYGGIDYQAQIDQLLQLANEKIVIFDDGSVLSRKLSDYIRQKRIEDIVYSKVIKNPKANLAYILKKNRKLKNASIFLNMPVVKSALVASQMSRYKVPYAKILSTQVNYSPLLFTLTQFQDRENFYIANAISEAPFKLEDINRIIGSDIRFNWINYAASVGMDKLFIRYFDSSKTEAFSEALIGQQIYYDTRIVRAGEGSFLPVERFDAQLPAEREEGF